MVLFFLHFLLFQGVPVDETTPDGRTCKTTVTMEGENKMIESQRLKKGAKKMLQSSVSSATRVLMFKSSVKMSKIRL